MFDLRSARYFIAVAEELHFGRAADRLRMSQPPLSQAIKQLEREVGIRLLDRTNRSVALTAAGAAFLEACRSLLLHADAVAEVPRLAARGVRTRVTVGTVASALSWPLPQALAGLREAAPELTVRIQELDTDEVVGRLADGSIDVALARLATSRPGVRTEVLLRDQFCVLLPGSHPMAAPDTTAEPIELGVLADEPWVWLAREVSVDYHDEMAAACRAAGFSPRVHHWARSIATQIAIVQCGAGVTIIPHASAAHLPETVCIRSVRDAARTVTLSVSTRARPDPAVGQLVGQIRLAARRSRHSGPGA